MEPSVDQFAAAPYNVKPAAEDEITATPTAAPGSRLTYLHFVVVFTRANVCVAQYMVSPDVCLSVCSSHAGDSSNDEYIILLKRKL